MLREIGVKDYVMEPKNDADGGRAFSKAKATTHARESSHYPQTSMRKTRFHCEDLNGVASPSDLRRPRDKSRDEVVGIRRPMTSASTTEPQAPVLPNDRASTKTPGGNADAESTQSTPEEPAYPSLGDAEVTAQESSLVEQLLSKQPSYLAIHAKNQADKDTWRQTVLEGRVFRKLEPLPDNGPTIPAKLDRDALNKSSLLPPTHTEPSGTADAIETPKAEYFSEQPSWSAQGKAESLKDNPRTTAKKPDSLPEGDIEFRNADEIRAAIKTKRRKFMSTEEQMIGNQKLNPEEQKLSVKPSIELAKTTDAVNGPVENNVQRMARRLEQSGTTIANHFRKDPTEGVASKNRLLFDKVMSHIRKGRVAMRPVIEDLENDIPASKPLLKRMKKDEDLLDSAINALRLSSGDAKDRRLLSKKLQAIQTLRLKFQDTDHELETAFASLREPGAIDPITVSSPMLKRRLAIASRIIHKNLYLTRHLTWSLQAYLEEPEIKRDLLTNYKITTNSLLTLRDTQIALSRLTDRVMSIYGVDASKIVDDLDSLINNCELETDTEPSNPSIPQESITTSYTDKTRICSRIAGEEHLNNQIGPQKIAMEGLSNDEHAHTPKPVRRKSFGESSPLAHSLFRPFGPISAGLSQDTCAAAFNAEEEAKNSFKDTKSVEEVRGVHKDTHDPTAVGHEKLAQATGEVKKVLEGEPKKTELSNDDRDLGSTRIASFKTTHIKDGNPLSSTSSTDTISVDQASTAIEIDTPSRYSSEDSTRLLKLSELPTHYTILIYNSQSDSVSATTSTSPPPRDTTPAIPLPLALDALHEPQKFIPYMTEGFEIVSAKKDLLVLRDSFSSTAIANQGPNNTVSHSYKQSTIARRNVNPIDGTTRLSPTGYVGPAESQEQLEKEFEERRHAACKINGDNGPSKTFGAQKENAKGGVRSVVKTAIWAAATCYVFGVIGEIVSGS